MDDIERRQGERRSGPPDRRAEGRAGDRRMGDRRLSVDANLGIYKRQCEADIDNFAAKLRAAEEVTDQVFNKIVEKAKLKLNKVWEKYKKGLADADNEKVPEKGKLMLKAARDEFENETRFIKNEIERELEAIQLS